jgi:hypothetical protein
MGLKRSLAALTAVLAVAIVAAGSAHAGGRGHWDYGWSYYPAYYPAHVKPYGRHARPVVAAYFVTDPYAYRYEPRGYYPYYDAGYWRPLCANQTVCVPAEFQPPYWKAWGYPKPWRNREFHRAYHGRIWPWHW